MRERSRILFVSNTDTFFLTYRLPLARLERDRGAEVVVAAPESGLGRRIEQEGFRFVPLPLSRRGVHPVVEARTLWALIRLYREFRPHLVHHLTIKPVLYGTLAAWMTGHPAVVNAITGLGFVFTRDRRARLLRPLVRALYRRVCRHPNSRTIFENPDDLREFVEMRLVRKETAALIPGLGVDCARFRSTPERDGEPLVVLPCRMLWDKGVREFVEAVQLLRTQGVPIRSALVGNPDPGNPSSIPVQQLEAWAREGIVEWWGQRDDMPEVFACAHVIVLPTRYREGVPRVLLEAAAAGRALIATDMPGCREVVRPGVNGFLISPGDSVGLATAIRSLAEDPALRRRLGEAGRKIAASDFAQEIVIERMLRLHNELMHPQKPDVQVSLIRTDSPRRLRCD